MIENKNQDEILRAKKKYADRKVDLIDARLRTFNKNPIISIKKIILFDL